MFTCEHLLWRTISNFCVFDGGGNELGEMFVPGEEEGM
jgi:hypothetical protein